MGTGDSVVWPAAEPLRLGAPLLVLQPAPARGLGRLRQHPSAFYPERPAELLDEPLDGKLTVPELAPLVLCHRTQHRPCAGEDTALLGVR